MKKFFIITGAVILILVVAVLVFLHNFSHRPLTDYNKNLSLKGLTADVQVYRDADGVPQIVAQNETDLYRAAGYVAAEDRLWQMDLIRRATKGTLSEIFGKDFVKTDLLLRALNISEKSQRIYSSLTEKQKSVLEAYADGVNQYINDNPKKLPIEFKILGYKPKPWTPENSLNVIGYMAWDLVMAWNNEITLYEIQQRVDSSLFADFIPNYDNDSVIYHHVVKTNGDIKSSMTALGENMLKLGIVPFMASNNWAVDAKKSANGAPILCNDMHLGYSIPGIWYQMHLIVKGKLNVTGVSIAGTPGIVSGHNDSIAWGMTNVMLDGTDFYIETLNKDSTKYLLNGKWKNLKIVNEKIATKEGDTVTLPLRYTHRGPIISEFKNIHNKAISMRWIGYEMSNEYEGVYELNHANNWRDFLKACKNFGAVSQNIIFADTKGNIGIKLTGLIPIRKIPGFYVLPGDTTLYDWQGFVPFDKLPVEYDPKDGFLASANNKSSNNVDYYISQYYYQDYRYRRIAQMLRAKNKISRRDMQAIQTDQHSLMADDLLPKMIFELGKLNLKTPEFKKIMTYLKAWNGDMNGRELAPLFFEQFNILFIKNSVEDELGTKIYGQFIKSKILANNILKNLWNDTDSPLFDNINTKNKKEDIDDIAALTFKETVDTLKDRLGDDIDSWQYQKLHTLTLKHPLAKVKILNFLFNLNRGPYGVGGSNHTISPYNYSYKKPFAVTSGASERHIYTAANWSNSLTIIPTGESGIPASKFYCNQTDRYIANKYHKEYFSLDEVKKNYKFKMTFTKK